MDYQFIAVIAIVCLLIVLCIPVLNKPLIWLLSNYVMPGALWVVQKTLLWGIWLVQVVVSSHLTLIRHLVTPRSLLLPNLDEQNK